MVLAMTSTGQSPLDRCTVQRVPRHVVTTRAWIRRFWLPREGTSVKPCVWSPPEHASVERTVNALSAKMAMFEEMEQNFNNLTPRVCKVETFAASASIFSGSARSWLSVEKIDGCTAAGSQDHLTAETHDEDLILSPLPMMNNHEVPSWFLLRTMPPRDWKLDWNFLGRIQYAGVNQTFQNSLQCRFRISQASFWNTRQMPGLYCSISRWWYLLCN